MKVVKRVELLNDIKWIQVELKNKILRRAEFITLKDFGMIRLYNREISKVLLKISLIGGYQFLSSEVFI